MFLEMVVEDKTHLPYISLNFIFFLITPLFSL